MKSELGKTVSYHLPIGDQLLPMNDLLGKQISLTWHHEINCIRCGRKTSKSFAQGFCYPCFTTAPETSECILRPELCRAHEGISRDMEWSGGHCLQDHIVYLALSGGVKVGVTRLSQVPTRWIDQGAWKTIRLARTPNRYMAGSIEVALKEHMNDKTNWRHMLTNSVDASINLHEEKENAIHLLPDVLADYLSDDDEITEINYPVISYPDKVKSISFDKTDQHSGILTGIKGQYLIFEDKSVLNIRKHGGYLVSLDCMHFDYI